MEFHESETIIHKARPHWIVFGWAVWLLYLGASFVWSSNRATSRQAAQTWLILVGAPAFYALVAPCIAQLYRWSSSLTITSRRVILKNGILRQRSTEFLLPAVESVLVEFPVTGRLFNYGTVTVRGFGGSREFIKRISRPERVRKLVQEHQSFAPNLHRTSRGIAAKQSAP